MYASLTYEKNNFIYYVSGKKEDVHTYMKEHIVASDNPDKPTREELKKAKVESWGASSYQTKKEKDSRMNWLENEHIPSIKYDEIFAGKEVKFLHL